MSAVRAAETLLGPGRGAAGACALVWVEGPDAAGFLQGLLTADVAGLEPGATAYSLVLDNRGRIQGDMRVHRDGEDAFTLVVEAGQGEAVAELLHRYHFSEDLEVIGPEPFALVTAAAGVEAPEGAADLVLPGRLPGTVDLVAADAEELMAAAGLAPAPAEALETLRVEAGVPRFGVDMGTSTLVQEAGLEHVAVSFEKGCYLGQETVARAQHRGRVNRRLRGLFLPAPAAAGAEVHHEGRAAGRLTSVAVSPAHGAIGLATLRREVPPGAEVAVDGVDAPARVVELPFG
ncbi:MAG TPA: glycine cleavage T C-terminal barrel domain-containing protein [Miltoncostaeaceae bacterium]|nr:glycine cleavage T C-terminal barrel domain-containing protein [Miltoncostaeaceae bacterium]